MPVHQPPDHEDDQDQPEYAADPCRAAAGSFPLGPMEPAVEQRPNQEVSGLKVGSQASTYNEG